MEGGREGGGERDWWMVGGSKGGREGQRRWEREREGEMGRKGERDRARWDFQRNVNENYSGMYVMYMSTYREQASNQMSTQRGQVMI